VRSSGRDEGKDVLPGTHISIIGVSKNSVVRKLPIAWSSFWSPIALSYRDRRGQALYGENMSVIVMPVSPADVSGVITASGNAVNINAGYGLMAAVSEEIKADFVEMYSERMKVKDVVLAAFKPGRLTKEESIHPKYYIKLPKIEGLTKFADRVKVTRPRGVLTKELLIFIVPREDIFPDKRYELWVDIGRVDDDREPVRFKFDWENLPDFSLKETAEFKPKFVAKSEKIEDWPCQAHEKPRCPKKTCRRKRRICPYDCRSRTECSHCHSDSVIKIEVK